MLPFLRIPPFPRHRASPLTRRPGTEGAAPTPADAASARAAVAALRRERVGGTFWAAPPVLPAGRTVVLCPSRGERLGELVAAARESGDLDRAVVRGHFAESHGLPHIAADCDPWALCAQAGLVIADAREETALVAALDGTALRVTGEGPFADLEGEDALAAAVAAHVLARWHYRDPFHGGAMPVPEAIALLGRWRRQIERNRQIRAIYGVARWKRVTSDAMLWDGTGPVRHRSGQASTEGLAPGDLAMAWVARTDAPTMAALAQRGARLGEIEDGMIRSTGLGANCVPPLSIAVDALGPHFDPAQPSELEEILQAAGIDDALLERAAKLRAFLVESGISKYGHDAAAAQPRRPAERRRTVLVAGQVGDDRSILRGGAGLDNFALLERARAREPDAHLVFKPHPDVETGHRTGHIPDARVLALADEIDRTSSIAALLARVDAVHVITSLAGFEALLRGREVITHGVPFYAGWGLTQDLGPVPARRTRQRTLDELVAATLILYPRYLDPVTRLPCEPEVLVARIAAGQSRVSSPLIVLREALGQARRLLR